MIERITTLSGSIYEIDRSGRRWRRMSHPAWSTALRTEGGRYRTAAEPRVGVPLVITADPLTPGTDLRVIETSPVTKVESLEQEEEK
jgi:hypothetical protein